MRVPAPEVAWYTLGSGLALAADVGLLAVLHGRGWSNLSAASVSFAIGIVIVYVFSVTLAFRHRRVRNRSLEFSTFAAIGAMGLGINAGAIFIGTKFLALKLLPAKCGASLLTFVFNFLARRRALFTGRSTPVVSAHS